jgi:hypothetical protein
MTTKAFDVALFVPAPANVNDGVLVSSIGPPFATSFKPVVTSANPGVTVGASMPAATAQNQALISGPGPGFAWTPGALPGGGGPVVTSVAGRTGDVVLTHTDITDWGATLAPYALTTSLASYLPLAGGTLTGPLNGVGAGFSGNLNCGGNFDLTGASPGFHSMYSFNGTNAAANLRWLMGFANNAESGTATGSDFWLTAYDNTGTFLFTPLAITRATGRITTSAGMLIGAAAAGGGVYCKPGLTGAFRANQFNIDWTGSAAQLWVDGTNNGTITVSSDYRIKRDVADLPSMWEQAKALRPVSYKHQDYAPKDGSEPLIVADDVERWGFVAHELQETLIPDAATGEKDSPTHIQSPNPWTVIATLTKALQEAMARIEALEAAGAAP